jgi:cobalt-zinc-cadmium efflux system outer membrane protein
MLKPIYPMCALLAATLGCLSPGAWAQALTLKEALKLAQEHNPDVRQAELAVEGAQANVTIAGAAPNPVLTLQSFNINPNAGVGAGSLRSKTVDSAVRVDQLIERGGKRALRVENADLLASASASDARDTHRQVALLVAQAYYDLMAANERLAILRDTAQLFDQTVAAAQKRRKAGDLAAADVARAQVDAGRAQSDALQAESDLFQARQTLAWLTGQTDHAATLEAGDGWPALQHGQEPGAQALMSGGGTVQGDDEALLARRPDVLAAVARFDAAQSARKLALAQRSADITVGVQAEHYPTSAANTQGSGNSFGIALQIPLQVRYAYQGEIRAADAALDAAREHLHQARAQARADLDLARDRVRSSAAVLARYDDADGLMPAARKSADAAEFAFQHGALAIMDLLDVRRTYRNTQLDALAARAAYAKSLAALRAAASEGKQK